MPNTSITSRTMLCTCPDSRLLNIAPPRNSTDQRLANSKKRWETASMGLHIKAETPAGGPITGERRRIPT